MNAGRVQLMSAPYEKIRCYISSIPTPSPTPRTPPPFRTAAAATTTGHSTATTATAAGTTYQPLMLHTGSNTEMLRREVERPGLGQPWYYGARDASHVVQVHVMQDSVKWWPSQTHHPC